MIGSLGLQRPELICRKIDFGIAAREFLMMIMMLRTQAYSIFGV